MSTVHRCGWCDLVFTIRDDQRLRGCPRCGRHAPLSFVGHAEQEQPSID